MHKPVMDPRHKSSLPAVSLPRKAVPIASPIAKPALVVTTHQTDSEGSRDFRMSHWMRPRAAPAIAPAMSARRGVVTGTTNTASSPAIGKLKKAKTQNSQKRQLVEGFFITDSFFNT